MINTILFIIMDCYALYINHSWYKHCNELNNRWAEYCNKLNKKWYDFFHKIIEEEKQ